MNYFEKIKVGGSHEKTLIIDNLTRDNVTVLNFGMIDIISLRVAGKNYLKSDDPRKLKRGFFTVKNGKLIVHLFDKVVRPIVYVEYRNHADIFTVNSIEKLNRRSPARSDLYVKNTIKNKISWGCSPCKLRGIDTTRSIPSKLGKILFDGSHFILNTKIIAVIENDVIVPKVDVLTHNGEYLYNRVMSIFELSHVKTKWGLLNVENNEIFLNKIHIASIIKDEIIPTKTNAKLYKKVEKEIYRMINLDDTLEYVSPHKTNIKADLIAAKSR